MNRLHRYPIYLGLAMLIAGCHHTAPCRHRCACRVVACSQPCPEANAAQPQPMPIAPTPSASLDSADASAPRPAPRNALPTQPVPPENE